MAKSKSKNRGKKHVENPKRQKVNISQVSCSLCQAETKIGEDFVQCDGCTLDFHFQCAGITDIGEEESWRCSFCLKKVNIASSRIETDEVSVVNVSDSEDTSPTKVGEKVVVHPDVQRPDVILEDLDEAEISSVANHPKRDSGRSDRTKSTPNSDIRHQSTQLTIGDEECHSKRVDGNETRSQNRQSAESTGDARQRSVKSPTVGPEMSMKSLSSISSKELHLRYAKDKLELQEMIDFEMLNARLDAIKAKETRTKQYLEEVYKSRSERSGSSKGSNKTSKSHVSSWVKDQQSRMSSNSKITNTQSLQKTTGNVGCNVSISLNDAELESIQKRFETVSRQSNLDRMSSKSETIVGEATSQHQQTAKFIRSNRMKIPTSRSTMLSKRYIKNEAPTNHSEPPEQSERRLEVPSSRFSSIHYSFGDDQRTERDLGDQISYKKENVTFHPKISQSYSNLFPSYTESYKAMKSSTDRVQPYSYQPIYTSAFSSHPISSSVAPSLTNPIPRILNNRTFPMYQLPSIPPVLTSKQIAARQALPKWLPKFNGNPYQWPNFIKRFENTTTLCGFCADENLERLEKCLEGDARDIVESQLMMPECVPEIIQILFERFGRPELVMKATLDGIRKEPTIKHDRLEALSTYGYKVHSACNIIERLGLDYYLFNPELVQEILGKLPHQTRIDFAVYCENIQVVTLRTLANWMRALSRMINRISPIDTVFSSHSNEKKQNDKQSSSNQRNQERKDENSKSKSGYLNVHDGIESSATNAKSDCAICDNKCTRLEDCTQFKQFDVNQRWNSLKQHNLCRRCLKKHPGDCTLSKECGINGCVFKHNPLLHKDKNPKSTSKNRKSTDTKHANEVAKTGNSNTHFCEGKELFRTALVEVHHENRRFATFALLDEASSFTLMEREVANKLKLTGTPETICLLWTKGMHRQERTEVADLEISGKLIVNGKIISTDKYPLKEVNIVENLDLPKQSLPIEELQRKYKHLTDLPIIGYQNAKPTILIGIKNARIAVPLETIEGEMNDPIATRSRLGWQIYGTSTGHATGFVNLHRNVKCPCQDRDENLHKLVKDHFTIENFGVVASKASMDSKENEKALRLMKKHTIRKGDRFETKLLWKNDTYSLPDSYPMAMKRLNCLENKGSKVIDTINESIKDYIEKGYVSKLSPSEAAVTNQRTWYLPVFTVTHPKKPEKLRTVFDAAARVRGVSLNSVLFTGPDLSVSIVDILRRFREHRIGVNGDIKEMYHQVLVNEEDRNSQRFIWRNGDKSKTPDVYVMNVLTFGATCSPSLAQFVKNINATEHQIEYPRAAEAIIRNHYIDDLLDGADSEEEAIQLLKDVKHIHKLGGFEIRNFKSNSPKVLQAVGETSQIDQRISVDTEKTERILGMFWETKLDCFTFSLKFTKIAPDVLDKKRLPTKRELLSLLMSIYDPLGLLSHYLIHVKILLQDVWRSKVKWDDEIPANLRSNWNRWLELLPNVERLKIPRWYSEKLSPKISKKVELHVLVDAGEYAYSAVAYLRIEDENGVAVSMVGSKARVTPLKYLSIPRKELLASVLGTRFSQSIREGVNTPIDRRIIWSDSTTVLTWLRSEHQKYNQFVAHRIGEILEATEQYEWRWIPTDQNVADEATKWKGTPSFNPKSRWFSGPEFLRLSESDWPKLTKKILPNGTTEEMKLSCSHSSYRHQSLFEIWTSITGSSFCNSLGKNFVGKNSKFESAQRPSYP